ncbi:odorant receptor 94b-like [Bradysia coprophila]|uniref:odorant receptor 94b-like n=1 Tax=Bradysia coprophila TaxID=38358 RepID=UPI00187D8128|nr:odorant receptor 94b-like [Bradysia coprophila]
MIKKTVGTSGGVKILKFVLTCAGFWPRNVPYKWLSVLYGIYSNIILIFIMFLYQMSMLIEIFHIENVVEATNNLCMTLTLMTLFGKILNFKYFLGNIQSLLYFGEEFELENDEEVAVVQQNLTFYTRLVQFLLITANIAGPSNYVGAFLAGDFKLPYLAWYPFDYKSSNTLYAGIYFYQSIGMFLQSNLNVTMDLFSAYMMHIGSLKLQIVGRRLKKLSEFTMQGQLNLAMDGKANKRHISSLVRCIESYQRTWKYMNQLQQYFTYGFLIQIGLSGIVICFTAYQLTTTSPRESFALYSYMVLFGFCMVAQMSLPCYFGNEIILRHEALSISAYSSGWNVQSMEYRKIVIIFMELVKKRHGILVGNWFDLDLDVFTSVINFAYRLYAVLV